VSERLAATASLASVPEPIRIDVRVAFTRDESLRLASSKAATKSSDLCESTFAPIAFLTAAGASTGPGRKLSGALPPSPSSPCIFERSLVPAFIR